jgi:hypothetical protein
LEEISEPKLMPLFNMPGGKAADFHRSGRIFYAWRNASRRSGCKPAK